jgi:hypothetical protein
MATAVAPAGCGSGGAASALDGASTNAADSSADSSASASPDAGMKPGSSLVDSATGDATTGDSASASDAASSADSGDGSSGAADASSSDAGPASATGPLVNGLEWADTSGHPIQAHGGGMLQVGPYYYWFGENRNPDGTFFAVSCYRSADLRSWEHRGDVLTMNSAAELKPADIERPKVAFNASTGQYVMWMHWENGSDYGQARAAVAVGSTVDGAYTYQGSFRPLAATGVMDHGKPGYMSRDCGLFVDTDGTAYFISATNENTDLNLYRLTPDYLGIDRLEGVLMAGQHREAPALFKREGVYFLLTSAATGWSPNQAQYATSSTIGTGWTGLKNVGDSTTFDSQAAFVVPVQGSSATTYLYMGDRWAGAWSGPVNDSTYVWEPISFPTTTSMTMSWTNTLTIDTVGGTVSGVNNRFAFVNKKSGDVMEVQGSSTADGGAVVVGAENGGDNQKWTLNYDGAGYFRVTNVKSGLVLDVPSSSTADGTALDQWTSNGGDNQQWRIIDVGGGSFELENKHSAKLVEVSQGSTASGAAIDQRAANGGSEQLWQIVVDN